MILMLLYWRDDAHGMTEQTGGSIIYNACRHYDDDHVQKPRTVPFQS